MHQPLYRDAIRGSYMLPWVRLHGIKDYLDMALLAEEFPEIHQTFNLVPSLIEQINDYVEGGFSDLYLDYTLKEASMLNEEERIFILKNFFLANWENMIKPFPRYWELLNKRGLRITPESLSEASRYFTDQEILDIQILFNLCWFDPYFRQNDDELKELVMKGRNYEEKDKIVISRKQKEILSKIIPTYHKLMENSLIEISVSPYYHPILPLLCNSQIAKESNPDIKLRCSPFSYKEDAEVQIKKSIRLYRETFGRDPKGMWPPEGSVSEEAVFLIAKEGINWIATDEGIIERSLTRDITSRGKEFFLYKPYIYEKEGVSINIIFRDRTISDLISFNYWKEDTNRAVDDLMGRIKKISSLTADYTHPPLISIILDGENPWEYYRNDGRDFLVTLYRRLSSDKEIKCVTVSEALSIISQRGKLTRIYPGSWINSNFDIWIGHEEDQAAWDLIKRARDMIVKSSMEEAIDRGKIEEAWEEIFIAEGSDWFWWYGDEHQTELDREFDELFRSHLRKIYLILEKEVPEDIFVPIIKEDRVCQPDRQMKGFISPVINGKVDSYFEWLEAAYYRVKGSGREIHQVQKYIDAIYYGFNLEMMFIRIDPGMLWNNNLLDSGSLQISFLAPKKARGTILREGIEFTNGKGGSSIVGFLNILEMAIPFNEIGARPGDEVRFFINMQRGAVDIEKWPKRGYFSFIVPSEEFEGIMWQA